MDMDIEINNEVQQTLLKYVRLVIAERLGIDIAYSLDDLDFSDQLFSRKYGAFVTLHIDGRLRGCIGYIMAVKTLKETIHDMALSAAFRDPRFNSLTAAEFDAVDIEISVLSPIETVNSIEEISVGRDGLIISKGLLSGLLLPQVATEHGWDRETFLDHTCMKAGLMPGVWSDEGTKIEKFSAFVFGEKK